MKYRPFLLTAAAVCAGTVALTLASPVASAADDASGTPSESTSDLERVSAYVQPSVVYLDVQWTGYVRDTFNRMYLNNGRPFVVDTQCTGYVVNPDGYIATAGHCVDPGGDIQDLIVQQAAQWALDHDYYASNSLSLEDVLGFDDYTIVNSEGQPKGPDRKVTAAWGVSAGGVDSGESYQARVLKYQPAGGHAAPPATASLNGSTPAAATNTTLVEARPVDAMTIHPEKAPLVRPAESAPQSGTAFCTSCGARALEHQRICGSCGTPL
jgi:hypothetical protein